MYKTSSTFNVLQALAVTAGLAIILWSIGLPSFRFAEAAGVSSYSDTLSDSAPNTASDHTISYVATSGVATSGTIVLTFDSAGSNFDLSDIGAEDIDLLENAVLEDIDGGGWTVGTTTNSITLTSDGLTSIAAGATTTILIGLNATGDGTADTQIVNPAATGSYEIAVASGVDTGTTEVAIVDSVTVTASVDTVFNFTVAGVGSGVDVNGSDSTGGATTATLIPFGELEASTASTAAQQLAVSTNANNGFNVTVQVDQQLTSTVLSADIDGFANGTYTSTPTAWSSPSPTPGSEETYGHWGISSDDTTDMALDFNGGSSFVSASTSPVTVFSHTDPVAGAGVGQGTTTVIYKTEISALQEAGTDYTATVTYVATPVF